MKRISSMLLFCVAIVLASCSKDDTTPNLVPVALNTLTANGSATETTTVLTLTFDKAIEGLAAADITLTAGETGAIKGALTAKGSGVYELAVSGITQGGEVTVEVAKTNYTITPASKTVTVYYLASVAVGDFYYNDKTYSATLDASKTCVGIVFWVDPADATKGKIVSLDEGYYLMSAAQAWRSSKTLPGGMTWSCPTKDELQHLYCGFVGIAATTWHDGGSSVIAYGNPNAVAFDAKLTAAGGVTLMDKAYWSSNNYASDRDAWTVEFFIGSAIGRNYDDSYSVRSVSAF